MKNGICPKCQSKEIVTNCTLSVSPAYGGAAASGKAWLQTEKRPVGIVEEQPRAWVCGSCGYVEFYISQPEMFLDAHKSWIAQIRNE